MQLSDQHPLAAHGTARSALVRAFVGDRPATVPVWFMRQAGRSLPEYRALRAGGSMLDACLDPDLASEITLQPVRRHGVDAAIFFSDIVIPPLLAGLDVTIVAGKGPVFAEPLRTGGDIARATRIDPARVRERGEPIARAVENVTRMLREESERRGEPIPLIGFAGAPFTLAAYLVEGGPSKDHLAARRLMHEDPTAWRALTEWLADLSGEFLRLQVEAGASAAQVFDSWAGSLAPDTYRAAALPATARTLAHVRALTPPAASGLARIPLAHFGVGTGELLGDIGTLDVDTVGIDHRVPLDVARVRLGVDVTVQGNLDPALLFAPADVREAAVRYILARGRDARAHVFNLGHGVPPEADPDTLTELVSLVHAVSAEGA
jgi:uroporphyrinogen decarboxylase